MVEHVWVGVKLKEVKSKDFWCVLCCEKGPYCVTTELHFILMWEGLHLVSHWEGRVWSVQCDVTFVYQLFIRCRTWEDYTELTRTWSIAAPSVCKLICSQLQWRIQHAKSLCAISVTGRVGRKSCETSRLPRCLDNQLTDGSGVINFTG
jgi:hypothetical protein